METKDRIFFQQGQYKVRLLNDKIVGVGDSVIVKFSNGNFVGKVKQTAGFGLKWDIDTISIVFPGKKNGKMIYINNILDKRQAFKIQHRIFTLTN